LVFPFGNDLYSSLARLPFQQRCAVLFQLLSFFSWVSPPVTACIALAGAKKIPEYLINVSKYSSTMIFSSIYDEYHLESRLIGLLREKTEKETSLSGGLIVLEGMGILMTGDSGVGKTTCALELVRRGCRWVADDVVFVKKKGDGLLADENHQLQ